jgi:hypothetical protein
MLSTAVGLSRPQCYVNEDAATVVYWLLQRIARPPVSRVRRSYSLKAKLSENEWIFFALCSHASESLQNAKTMGEKRKELCKILQFP